MSWAEDMGYDCYTEEDFEPALVGRWCTADGQRMDIVDMDNKHLKNAYLKLVRENKRLGTQGVLLDEINRRKNLALQLSTALEDFEGLGS